MAGEHPILDGLVTFYASHHAVRAERVLAQQGLSAMLVPGPREISPNCGVALQFEYRCAAQVRQALTGNHVQIEGIHEYRVEADEERIKRLRDGL